MDVETKIPKMPTTKIRYCTDGIADLLMPFIMLQTPLALEAEPRSANRDCKPDWRPIDRALQEPEQSSFAGWKCDFGYWNSGTFDIIGELSEYV